MADACWGAMLYGAHESVRDGLFKAFERATGDGAKAVQIFTKSSGMWREPILEDAQLEAFHDANARWKKATGGAHVLAHTSYLINLATDNVEILEKSKSALVAELQRSSALGVDYVVVHPGAHLGAGCDEGVRRVAEALDEIHDRAPDATAKILLENTAGQGSCVGCTFEELGGIFDVARSRTRFGVCFDTQHAFAAGYDLSTPQGYADTFAAFERHVGLARLKAFHLNDSKKALGSRVDRHEHVGTGILGRPFFWRLLNDARFTDVPGVIEIEPKEGVEFGYLDDLGLLASLVGAPEPQVEAAPFVLELVEAPKKRKLARR